MAIQRVTLPLLHEKKVRGEKIAMVTCYDYPSARLLDAAGVDILFIGDSLGANVLGYRNSLPVTLDEIVHHASAVRRGARHALVLADMPFMSYQVSPEDALRNAGRLLKESEIHAVKIEGGAALAPTVKRMVEAGIPVMSHIGLMPQSVNVVGGHRLQGTSDADRDRLITDARALADAGAFAVVIELVPNDVARQVTESVEIPTIGIGAGPCCDGQVQVFHDLFGLFPDRTFRHSKRYTEAGAAIQDAAARFVEEVRSGTFPAPEHGV